jgi:hypothetical protein
VKRLVVGTRWEVPIKRVHHALTHRKNSLHDCQTVESPVTRETLDRIITPGLPVSFV